jgi:hypothetical protein
MPKFLHHGLKVIACDAPVREDFHHFDFAGGHTRALGGHEERIIFPLNKVLRGLSKRAKRKRGCETNQ